MTHKQTFAVRYFEAGYNSSYNIPSCFRAQCAKIRPPQVGHAPAKLSVFQPDNQAIWGHFFCIIILCTMRVSLLNIGK